MFGDPVLDLVAAWVLVLLVLLPSIIYLSNKFLFKGHGSHSEGGHEFRVGLVPGNYVARVVGFRGSTVLIDILPEEIVRLSKLGVYGVGTQDFQATDIELNGIRDGDLVRVTLWVHSTYVSVKSWEPKV